MTRYVGTTAYRPTVGLSGYFLSTEQAEKRGFGERATNAFTNTYLERVVAVGLLPICLPAGRPELAAEFCARVEAIILTGGDDISPERYNQLASPLLGQTSPARDEFEFALLDAALARDIPILGICRGMQMLNVALGGTLHQDMASAGVGSVAHNYDWVGPFPTHDVQIISPVLWPYFGKQRRTNSFHHQSIDKLAAGLELAGVASDGVIEAVLNSDRRILGVQWHPESLSPSDVVDPAPFEWLADVVASRRDDPLVPEGDRAEDGHLTA